LPDTPPVGYKKTRSAARSRRPTLRSRSVSDNKLVLHPENPTSILQDPPELLESLRQLRLIGASFNHLGELHHKAGPRFAELVVFKAGAAPPPARGDEVTHHVALTETTENPVFLGGANARAPVCPGCQAPFDGWRERLQEWQTAPDEPWTCARCGRRRRAHELDWARRGGFARYALDIWNIREDEAVPSPELLELLRVMTYDQFTWFYYRFP
jgi:hypothetical protein